MQSRETSDYHHWHQVTTMSDAAFGEGSTRDHRAAGAMRGYAERADGASTQTRIRSMFHVTCESDNVQPRFSRASTGTHAGCWQ